MDKQELSLSEQIQQIARKHVREEMGEESVTRFLMLWWSNHYKRPLKDPVLQSYSLEELMYEYYIHMERNRFEQEQLQAESDRIEEEKMKADEDWADEMERMEAEEHIARAEAQKKKQEQDMIEDPEHQEWMQKQIEEGQTLFDDFGQDLSLDFGEDS